jgi:hypothetical protein
VLALPVLRLHSILIPNEKKKPAQIDRPLLGFKIKDNGWSRHSSALVEK